jgi:hypothetical protein
MKVVDNCDIFPVALVWHENLLWLIYYDFTMMYADIIVV